MPTLRKSARYAACMLCALLGDAKSQYIVARKLFESRSSDSDTRRAVYWATRAAENGSSSAQCLLASFHIAGFGVRKDYRKAAQLYELAAKQGDPDGHHSLAWCYFNAVGVEKNLDLAFQHWLEAAKEGVPESQAAVADCLLNGFGTEVDLQSALEWCDLAIRNGAKSEVPLRMRIAAEIANRSKADEEQG